MVGVRSGGGIVSSKFAARARQVMENIRAILNKAPTCRWYTAKRVGLDAWFDESDRRRRDRRARLETPLASWDWATGWS